MSAVLNRKNVTKAIVDELRRQSNEDRAGTPYFDPDDLKYTVIDGQVDLEKLADAIVAIGGSLV